MDRILADLRAIVKNNPVIEVYARGRTRYLTGEYPILLTQSSSILDAKKGNVPAVWVSLEMGYLQNHHVMLRKGTANSNAAKLLAVFLASPDGHAILNSTGRGSMLYPGNVEFDIHQQDVKAGLRTLNFDESREAVEFSLSEKGQQIEKEIGDILKGG
ncbi:MAG: hypothetical protein HY675_28430 [Chloroflexi bacterium]|nr:hypothetical protein [Chloroflexota bacterium]